MSLPSAIHEDPSPFSVLGFFPGYQRFLIFVRWRSYKCPQCGCVFRRDFWPQKIRLGSGQRTCTQCDTLFDDGSREWPEQSTGNKLGFFVPPLLQGICGGLLVAVIIVAFIPPRDLRVVLVGLIISIMPLLVWCPVRMLWVIRSVRRYNKRGVSGAA